MDDISAILNKLELVIGAIIALLTKLVWDKARPPKKLDISGSAVELDSPVTQRDSVMIWLTDRLHKLRGELDVPITRNTSGIEELKIKYLYLEKQAAEQKAEIAEKIARLHSHIDERSQRIEERSQRLEDKIDSILNRILDKK